MVPAVLFRQCQGFAQDDHGRHRRMGAQGDICSAALKMQGAIGISARPFRENDQAAASGEGYACILNQAYGIAIGEEPRQPQVTAHHRVAK